MLADDTHTLRLSHAYSSSQGLLTVGALEIVLALGWRHAFGVCVGLGACACAVWRGVPLIRSRAADWSRLEAGTLGCDARPGASARERAAVYSQPLLAVACCLLLLVRLGSPDVPLDTWPAACPAWLPDGCSRVAQAATSNAGALKPLRLHAPRTHVADAAVAWAERNRGTLLQRSRAEGGTLLHFRFTSRLWSFADDTLLLLTCAPDGATRVQAQSQLRLGRGDLGVNRARLEQLWLALQATSAASADSKPGACNADL